MNVWLTQHTQALSLVLRRFRTNKLGTLLICFTIGITVALPSIMYAVLDSVNNLTSNIKSESRISVFLALNHSDAAIQTIKAALEKNAAIKNFKFVSKEEALGQLQALDTNKDVLHSLEKNPLPDAFFVEPSKLDAESIENLKAALSKMDGVEEVIVDGAWIKRLNYLLLLGQKAMLAIAGLLAFALAAVIANTIRMQIVTQSAEIELSQLIGATRSFIRRPFLYAGALYGLIGGLFALLITFTVIFLFNQSLAPLAAEYQTSFSLTYPSLPTSIITCLLSIVVGLISAYLAVSKSMYKLSSSH
ncbi:MAG TPA: permease-like cell division protein FtsX [Methylotenera sp.]|nr:permease-like cell division protein FtsX [Methylotenera sp.]HPV45513.1 permease-like cell division protein FtsX [Methylotenera sp.]